MSEYTMKRIGIPDMCEMHQCENPYNEDTGDWNEGHWVCNQEDCATT